MNKNVLADVATLRQWMGAHGLGDLLTGAHIFKDLAGYAELLGGVLARFVPVLGHRYNPLAAREVRVGPEIIERLLDINRGFYQSFAKPFIATRGRLQPGVTLYLESLPLDATVLDLGCAHGVLAEELKGRGFSGCYVGLDSSRPLLESISDDMQPPYYKFGLADLSSRDWPVTARTLLSESECQGHFDLAFAFAVLHHLPSTDLRKSVLGAIHALLGTEGRIALSVWDFLASSRLRERIVPWETADIRDDEVDEGDYLIDWREGGIGVRYVHHFSPEELQALAGATGYRVANEYRSDGENGRLGLYQIWEVV